MFYEEKLTKDKLHKVSTYGKKIVENMNHVSKHIPFLITYAADSLNQKLKYTLQTLCYLKKIARRMKKLARNRKQLEGKELNSLNDKTTSVISHLQCSVCKYASDQHSIIKQLILKNVDKSCYSFFLLQHKKK